MTSSTVIEAVAVTAELTGTSLSPAATKILCEELAPYPEKQVLGALVRCRRELKGRLSLSEILSRLDDGRPGPEEAFAMLPRNEAQTVVWTTEMQKAWGVSHMVDDQVAARMAFKEAYTKIIAEARANGDPVVWQPSIGHDPLGREGPLREAAEKGRLSTHHVQSLLPPPNDYFDFVASLTEQKRLKNG